MTALCIEVIDPAAFEDVHRLRNFGEEIYRGLQDTCTVSLDEIDRATTAFTIRAIRPRDLGAVMHTIKRALRKHHLEKDLRIVRI